MKVRPKVLVILTPAFPADESETSWVPTQQLFVKELKEQYPQLRIVVLSFYHPRKVAQYEWKGIEIRSFNGLQRRKWKRPFFWHALWKDLRALRQENEIIGLFSFWCGECALIGSYFGQSNGIKHYCWLCGQDARASNKLVKFIRPGCHELIAMSDFLAKEFYRNHGIRPLYTIPNGIDPALFGPRPTVEPASTGAGSFLVGRRPMEKTDSSGRDAPERDIDILGVGSLSRLKRYDLLVAIVALLKDSFPSIRARICGEGEERENLSALIKTFGLEENLALTGEKPQQDAIRLMQRTKVFLHTSDYEGFGVACLEALYAGAYVISFSKPMEQDIPRWTIVKNAEEMRDKAAEILRTSVRDHQPVLPYTMADSVKAVMHLFERYRGIRSD